MIRESIKRMRIIRYTYIQVLIEYSIENTLARNLKNCCIIGDAKTNCNFSLPVNHVEQDTLQAAQISSHSQTPTSKTVRRTLEVLSYSLTSLLHRGKQTSSLH